MPIGLGTAEFSHIDVFYKIASFPHFTLGRNSREKNKEMIFLVSQFTSYPLLIKAFPLPALEVLKEVQTPLQASKIEASQIFAPDKVSLAMVHLQKFCYWFQPHFATLSLVARI